MVVKVPERFRAGLENIAGLEESEIHELAQVLGDIKPSLSKKRIISRASKRLQHLASKVAPILDSLVGMISMRAYMDIPLSRFLKDLFDGDVGSEAELDLPESTIDLLRERLSRLLSVPSIAITGKAYGVMTAHERVFGSSRVFTDVRPVFTDTDENAPPSLVSTVIVHMLRIGYTADGEWKHFFIALDDNDIKRLMKSLERATAKSSQLKEAIAKAGYRNLAPEQE